jgi:hypothetical protein
MLPNPRSKALPYPMLNSILPANPVGMVLRKAKRHLLACIH